MKTGIRELSKEQTREELLKSAHILFCKKGFHSVSIDEIAQESNVTKGAFYHHFASKNDIFESCFVLQAQRIENLLKKVKVSSDPFVEAVNKAKSFLTFVRDEQRNLIPLDEVITVLGWRRWKEIDISFTMKFITDSLLKLKDQHLIQNYSIDIIADTIHGMLANFAMIVASSPKDANALNDAINIFQNFLSSLRSR